MGQENVDDHRTETPRHSERGTGSMTPISAQGDAWQSIPYRKRASAKAAGLRCKGVSRRNERVTIKVTENLTYAEALRKIKSNIDLTKIGVEVDKIRKTKTGELLVLIKKGSGKSQQFQKTLAAELGDEARVRVVSQNCTIEIRDLDEATEEEEVLKALRRATGSEPADFKVRAIRASYSGTKMAVVTTTTQKADTLVRAGKIEIGWVKCRVRERVEVVRCYRCMGFGHRSGLCEGPDRTNLCRVCGKEGHKGKDCTEAPHCPSCEDAKKKETDHIAGSTKCAVFKEELEKQKQKKKNEILANKLR